MKVLVTGAGGLLGREVVAHLRESGHTVRAHDRTAPDPATTDEVAGGDLLDAAGPAALLDGVDAVVHAAALPSPYSAPHDEVFTNNVRASYLVLDAAGRAGVRRVVNVSSLCALGLAFSAHGVSPHRVPVTEDHPYIGDDVYGLSKYVGEAVAATTSRRYGTTVVSLRFPFLGTGERLRAHLADVHRDPGVESGALWGWLDTRDAARAIGAALTAPVEGHPVVNVTAPDTTALRPTAELLRRYHPAARVEAPLDGFAVPFDLTRSRDLLGFTARHTWRG
ncbi:putative NAD-dependent epimerase/dehydratase [Actinacidiphila reveromycinica]|uniref:Putative NAD-dependent epimerase/dehydratase n=1 Tax=Actinacidiphila reveromycinica TaxID=659352 RepID=A0A7U3V0M0_9ACTN|nr:NAD(P)-dependent oxidoreductase [Streptomyces sp. SN-593]BBB02173.1 putative NAD-dependent epimerase/dehydratase [Streptomyces sp. SN-593]